MTHPFFRPFVGIALIKMLHHSVGSMLNGMVKDSLTVLALACSVIPVRCRVDGNYLVPDIAGIPSAFGALLRIDLVFDKISIIVRTVNDYGFHDER